MRVELPHIPTELGTKIIDGKFAEQEVTKYIRENFDLKDYKVAIHLVEPQEENSRTHSSLTSLRKKMRLIENLGATSEPVIHAASTSLDSLAAKVEDHNKDPDVAAIIVQFPIPSHLTGVRHVISPEKDIDALNPANDIWDICATAEAASRILQAHENNLRSIAVVGSRGFVGRQVSHDIQQKGFGRLIQVEFDDSLDILRECETVISAVGQPNLIQSSSIEGAYLGIDIGNTKVNNKVQGDFDVLSVYGKIDNLTPVPGGMGPLEMVILSERIVKNAINPNFTIQFNVT